MRTVLALQVTPLTWILVWNPHCEPNIFKKIILWGMYPTISHGMRGKAENFWWELVEWEKRKAQAQGTEGITGTAAAWPFKPSKISYSDDKILLFIAPWGKTSQGPDLFTGIFFFNTNPLNSYFPALLIFTSYFPSNFPISPLILYNHVTDVFCNCFTDATSHPHRVKYSNLRCQSFIATPLHQIEEKNPDVLCIIS